MHRAFYYPLILLSIAGVMLVLMLAFVVPQFELLFAEANARLPHLTYWLIRLSNHIHIYLMGLCVVSIGLSVMSIYFQKARKSIVKKGRENLIHLPWIGAILHKMILVRFSHTLMITLSAGLPLTEGLLAAAGVVQYDAYRYAILRARDLVMEGVVLDQALASTGYFPDMMLQVINTGQMTGRLVENFAQLTDYFETQLDESLNIMTSLLEPALILLVGCGIGGLMLALYWPIFELGTVMGSI